MVGGQRLPLVGDAVVPRQSSSGGRGRRPLRAAWACRLRSSPPPLRRIAGTCAQRAVAVRPAERFGHVSAQRAMPSSECPASAVLGRGRTLEPGAHRVPMSPRRRRWPAGDGGPCGCARGRGEPLGRDGLRRAVVDAGHVAVEPARRSRGSLPSPPRPSGPSTQAICTRPRGARAASARRSCPPVSCVGGQPAVHRVADVALERVPADRCRWVKSSLA